MSNFEKAVEHVFHVEGGYSDHPEDKGGETRYGITERTFYKWTEDNFNNVGYPWHGRPFSKIDKDQAGAIYRDMYWNEIRGDELPRGVSLMVFDSAVHAGPVRAIKWLQRAVGEKSDGIFGPKTLLAINRFNGTNITHYSISIVEKIAGYRLLMARKNETFVKGWFRRIIHVLVGSVEEILLGVYLSPK